jgi:hypothetical protein
LKLESRLVYGLEHGVSLSSVHALLRGDPPLADRRWSRRCSHRPVEEPAALEGALLGIFLGWIGIVVEVVLPALPESEAPAPIGAWPSRPAAPTPSLDIINERYARGEISREEYQQLRADLGS